MLPDPQVVAAAGGLHPGSRLAVLDDVFGFRCWSGTPEVMAVAHRHDDIEVNVVVAGELTYLFGGRTVRIGAGEMGAFWAVMPHQLVATRPGSRSHWLTIPLPMFLGWPFPPAARTSLLAVRPLIGRAGTDPRLDHVAFAQWADDLGSGSGERRSVAALEIQARLRRLAATADATMAERKVGGERTGLPTESAAGSESGPDVVVGHAAAMTAFVATHYAQPIGPTEIAGAVHLHPHYAMTVFRDVVGTTLGRYLSECRVAQAQRLLVTTDLTVGEVAVRSGFSSSSRFFATFAQVSGTSPGAYRRHAMADSTGPV
jgi:AraC-like DNA-binding protein